MLSRNGWNNNRLISLTFADYSNWWLHERAKPHFLLFQYPDSAAARVAGSGNNAAPDVSNMGQVTPTLIAPNLQLLAVLIRLKETRTLPVLGRKLPSWYANRNGAYVGPEDLPGYELPYEELQCYLGITVAIFTSMCIFLHATRTLYPWFLPWLTTP